MVTASLPIATVLSEGDISIKRLIYSIGHYLEICSASIDCESLAKKIIECNCKAPLFIPDDGIFAKCIQEKFTSSYIYVNHAIV